MSTSPEIVEFEIPNWEIYNERQDRVNHTWIRFQNSFFGDQDLFGASLVTKLVLVFLLCERGKVDGPSVRVNSEYSAGVLRVKRDEFLESIQELSSLGFIVLKSADTTPASCRRDAGMMPYTYERTNERTYTGVTPPDGSLDFESLYAGYPRKAGKTAGLKACAKKIKTELEYARLKRAIERYANEMRGQPQKYIKHFSTFMNCWEDYDQPQPAISSAVGDLSTW